MTNAERLRQMTEEELIETIYQFMSNAVACPTCFYKNGKERLVLWMQLESNDD